MATTKVTFSSDDTLIVILTDDLERAARAEALLQDRTWLEVVPGARDITVQFDPVKEQPVEALSRLSMALSAPLDTTTTEHAELEIPVCYGAPFAIDLESLCRELNLTSDALIARHTSTTYRVAMMGFTPGFAYLSSDATALDVSRLAVPRQSVPAGSIGLAANQCGLYALPGPGGWPIIGRTPLTLFDSCRESPFLLSHGMTIRFKAISETTFQNWQAQ